MSTMTALMPYTFRATRWRQVGAGAGAGLLFILGMTLVPVTHDANGLTTILRFAALLGAVGAAFLLDDPSESSTVASPVSRRLRIVLRPLVALPAAALWWGAALLLLRSGADADAWQAVPVTGVTLEAVGLLAAAVAVAAVAVRRPPHDGGGVVAAPTVIALTILGQLVPRRFALFPAPGDPRWGPAHLLWVYLLVAALVLLLWATCDLYRTRRRPPPTSRGLLTRIS